MHDIEFRILDFGPPWRYTPGAVCSLCNISRLEPLDFRPGQTGLGQGLRINALSFLVAL